eukprot:8385689-Ditylum_brightwellii.AAC.1
MLTFISSTKEILFPSPGKAKEYLLLNYLIKKEYHILPRMYNHDEEMLIFTLPTCNCTTGDKAAMIPHFVLCSVDSDNLVMYACEKDGGGTTMHLHWISFPKIQK